MSKCRQLLPYLFALIIGFASPTSWSQDDTQPQQHNQDSTWRKAQRETGEALGAVGSATAETAGQAWDTTKDVSASAWETTKEVSTSVWDNTKQVSDQTWTATKDGATEIWQAVTGAVGQ